MGAESPLLPVKMQYTLEPSSSLVKRDGQVRSGYEINELTVNLLFFYGKQRMVISFKNC